MTKLDGSILKLTAYLRSGKTVEVRFKSDDSDAESWSDMFAEAMISGNGIHLEDVWNIPHVFNGSSIEYFNIKWSGMYD